MINLFPEADQLKYPIFKLFNQNYGDKIVSICPILTKYQVHVYTADEYLAQPQEIPKIEDIHDQSFASVVFKYQESAESTFAGIVYNKPLINKLCFTKDEQYAAISHEIGHILFFSRRQGRFSRHPRGRDLCRSSINLNGSYRSNAFLHKEDERQWLLFRFPK